MFLNKFIDKLEDLGSLVPDTTVSEVFILNKDGVSEYVDDIYIDRVSNIIIIPKE